MQTESSSTSKQPSLKGQLFCAPIIWFAFVSCFTLNPVNIIIPTVFFAAIVGAFLLLPAMPLVWLMQWGLGKIFSFLKYNKRRILVYLPSVLVCLACLLLLFDNPRDDAIQTDLGISAEHPGIINKGRFRQMMGFKFFRAGELEVTSETLNEILRYREYSDVDTPRPANVLSYYREIWGFSSIAEKDISYLRATDGSYNFWHLIISPDKKRIYWSYGND